MGPGLFLGFLLLLCCSAPCRSDLMVLGVLSVPECSSLLQENLEENVRSLRAARVDHVRVTLPRAALHSSGIRSCLQSILSSVSSSGLQPLLLLELSSLLSSEVQVSGSRPGSDSSLLSLEQELTVMFGELGDSAHTWLMLLEPNSEEQLQLYSQVQKIFRRTFPHPEHRLSLGLKSSDLSWLTSDLSHLLMDFLSVKLILNCDEEEDFGNIIGNIKRVFGENVPVVIYDSEAEDCPQHEFLGNVIRGQIKSELNLVGFDVSAMFDLKREQEPKDEVEEEFVRRFIDDSDVSSALSNPAYKPFSSRPWSFSPSLKDLPASDVPSRSKSVWEKFSGWSEFQSKLYHYGTFPNDFQWGVMSAAYQIEGGWNEDGKGLSIWDTFAQAPNNIPENANGDVACDSYNKLDLDLNLIKELGVKTYRFSISWSRIFPNGDDLNANERGVDYYNRLIDGLLKLNVAPVVTLYHWDLPQALQNSGGWENENLITLFDEYAEFCFKTFGDRVKFWITFNDPYSIAWKGYGSGELPPNLKKNPGVVPYKVGKNLLLAHARAYRTYESTYKPTQQGVVSIALNGDWYEPLDVNVPRELEAADRAMQFRLGWFAHPIFRNGDFPEAMKFQVKAKSDLQRLKQSRFTTLTEAEKTLIRGTADVFCLNHHTTKIARFSTQVLNTPSYAFDWDITEQEQVNYPHTGIGGPRAVPWGLRRVLNWIKHEYGDPEVYVTDNAMGTNRDLNTDDADRVFFLKSYIDEALKAQSLDGVRLRGYMGAGLMDSFEWLLGYTVGSGLNFVDYSNLARPRTPKYSSQIYGNIVRLNGFPRGEDETLLNGHFRDDMMWGTSTAAYQIEGGWRSDGKGLSIWDTFTHTPSRVKNGDNGDVACDSYNRIEEDVQQLLMMGVKVYRFSISWSRVLPDGTMLNVNEPGVNYYVRLVDALLQAGIQPLVTLYHWDLPQALQDVGGWQNVTVVDRFREYADLMFRRIGSKVKFWITFNEPWLTSVLGYGYGNHAPGINSDQGRIPYIVTHNLLKSHAEAWHQYNDNYRETQKGKISITINYDWAEPRNPNKQEDIDISNRHRQFFLGWFAHPIFRGDYPPLMKQIVLERSLAAGLSESRLPDFTPAEIRRINGTHDFFGLNHYMSVLAYPGNYGNLQTYDADRGAVTTSDWTWLQAGSEWLKVTPFGIRRLLKFVKEEYGNPQVLITENGVSDLGPVQLNDTLRQHFYTEYINQVLKAYLLDGVDVIGYTAWSVMDNLEWASGYTETFGLFYVNRSDPALPRTPKVSVQTYNRIIRCNGFPDPDSGHECLKPTQTTSVPTATKVPPIMSFLGLDLTVEEAETGLNVTFALLLVSSLAAVVAAGGFCLVRRGRKNAAV